MKNHSHIHSLPVILLVATLSLSGNFFFSTAQDSSEISIVETKRKLSERLDSLDLEKQMKKRHGISIRDIEIRQAKLIDSIQVVRQAIQTKAPEPLRPLSAKAKLLFFKPASLFDWIILIVGAIAAISGILLIYGIFKSLTRRQTPSGNKKSKPGKPAPIPKQPLESNARLTQTEQSGTELLANLRQRMDAGQIVSKADAKPTVFPEDLHKSNETANPKDQSENLESRIMQAAQDGLDIQEISRRFQVSADHVSLILKISGTRHRKI